MGDYMVTGGKDGGEATAAYEEITGEKLETMRNEEIQAAYVFGGYDKRLWILLAEEKYKASELDGKKASELDDTIMFEAALKELEEDDGHLNCRPSTLGGAIFWFTIMTTIGYGNTAPETQGGRALVFTFGLLSILLFT